jgi:hypothetical protein
LVDSIQWDGDFQNKGDVRVRGNKQYWHRPGAPLPIVGGKSPKDKVASWIQPAKRGACFTARIRFENLRDWELGALLAALELPSGCAHRLGMGKPLGLGSFRIHVMALQCIDRKDQRYQNLFAAFGQDGGARLATGAAPGDRSAYLQAFAEWFWKPKPEAQRRPSIWDWPRLRELKAILTLDGLPANWIGMTRYLKFGRIEPGRQLGGEMYNEYNNVGYPNKGQEPRRPLPPASQVLDPKERAKMPDDPEPPFEKPRYELRPKPGSQPRKKRESAQDSTL